MDSKILLLAAPLVAAELVMKIVALVSLRRQAQTRGPKAMWALVILFTSLVGWATYFAVGRKEA